MNETTRTALENLAVATLRLMDKDRLQIVRLNREIEAVRARVKDQSKKLNEYLDTIAQSDPTFDRKAWLHYAERELL